MSTTIKTEVKKIQCYHPTVHCVDEFGRSYVGHSEETIREFAYENGFTRTNTTTGEFQEFLH